ncbi:MAG: hypothetical protein IPJ75_14065 [Ignavibacteriales bacterium]|nr:hypothetical protein [Ignavibacteriales bacterium]
MQQLLLENFESGHNELLNTHTQYFEQVLRNGAHLADNSASFIKDNPNPEGKKLERILKDIISSEKVIYGAVVAFEPGVYKGKERFAPFYFETKDTVGYFDLSDSKFGYDYRQEEHKWYNIPATTKTLLVGTFLFRSLKRNKNNNLLNPILDGDKFSELLLLTMPLTNWMNIYEVRLTQEPNDLLFFQKMGRIFLILINQR